MHDRHREHDAERDEALDIGQVELKGRRDEEEIERRGC